MKKIVPKNPRSQHFFRFPFFFDLVEDDVRSRLIFPLATLSLYVLIVFALIGSGEKVAMPPSEVVLDLPTKDTYEISTLFSETFPAPRIRARNQDGAVMDVLITPVIVDLMTSSDETKPNCDSSSRKGISGGLEFIRLSRVCKVQKLTQKSVTNKDGRASFPDFSLERGPQGSYSISFMDEYGTHSDEINVFLKSVAANIIVLNQPPLHQDFGKPFQSPPLVRVLAADGTPVINKEVVAFSWPEPKFSGKIMPYLSQGDRYAELKENVAVTNQTGYAIFSNLTIMGANSEFVYIFFAVDGNKVEKWGVKESMAANFLDKNFYFNSPIRMNKVVNKLQIMNDIQKVIMEGQTFTDPPVIKVLGQDDKPLEGKIVFARIKIANGDYLPMGYPRYKEGYANKFLVAPVTGSYELDFKDPLIDTPLYEPVYTNKTGMVPFKDLSFSSTGQAGNYTISFNCDGVEIDGPSIMVTTSIVSVSILGSPPTNINGADLEFSRNFRIITRVLDENEFGIAGKSPIIRMLNSSNIEVPINELSIPLKIGSESFNPSDEEGYQTLFFEFKFCSKESQDIMIELNYDGITSKTQQIRVQCQRLIQPLCGSIETIFFPQEIRTSKSFTPVFKVYDTDGNPRSQANVYVEFQYTSDSGTQFPEGVYPNSKLFPKQKSDGNGEVRFFDIKFEKGAKGDIYVQSYTYDILTSDEESISNIQKVFESLNDPSTDDSAIESLQAYVSEQIAGGNIRICYSKETKLKVLPKVESIVIKDYSIDKTMFDGTVLKLGEKKRITLQFFDYKMDPVKSIDTKVDIQLLQRPSYANWLNAKSSDFLTLENNLSINSNGEMVLRYENQAIIKLNPINLSLTVMSGFAGRYAINFFTDGSYSDAFIFKTNMDADKIDIISKVNSKYDDEVGTPVGEIMSTFDVKVFDKKGDAIPFYYVYAAIEPSIDSERNRSIIDITDLGPEGKPFLVVSKHRITQTSLNGVASFKSLSILETVGKKCVSFRFYVGDESEFIKSTITDKICFKNSKSVSVYNSDYSKVLSQGNSFMQPVKIKVTKDHVTEIDKNGIMLFIAAPFKNGKLNVQNPLEESSNYFTNNICLYYGLKAYGRSASSCTPGLSLDSNGKGNFLIEFKKLKWTLDSDKSFQFSVSDPLNLIDPLAETNTTTAFRSSSIKVTNTPSVIDIYLQPPEIVYIKTDFKVFVLLSVSSGSPVTKGRVTASVTEGNKKSFLKNDAYNMIMSFADGFTDISSLGKFTKGANIQLTNSSKVAYTNRRGYAVFSLSIDTGLPGEYTLMFGSDKVKSQKSNAFTLMNKVGSINITEPLDNTLELSIVKGSKNKLEDVFYKLAVQPRLKLKYEGDSVDFTPKTVEVKIYKEVKAADFQNLLNNFTNNSLSATNSALNMDSLYADFENSDASIKSSPTSILQNIFNAVINGGKIVSSLNRKSENFPVKFSAPKEDAYGWVNFTDLSIKFKNTGSYQLLFVIDGMESPLSTAINVKLPEITPRQYALNIFEKLVILSVVVMVILANSSYLPRWLLIFGVIFVIVALGIIHLSDNSTEWKIFIYIVLALLLFAFVEIAFNLAKAYKQKTTPEMLFTRKNRLYREYTYQLLFKKASKQWRKKGEEIYKYDDPNFKAQQKNHGVELIKKESNIQNEISSQIQKDQAILNQDDKSAFDMNNYFKVATSVRIKRLFTPFYREYSRETVEDCFYYPQKFLAALLLGVISVIYICVKTFHTVDAAQLSVINISQKIEDAFYAMMKRVLAGVKEDMIAQLGLDNINEKTFAKVFSSVSYISDQFLTLSRSIHIAFIISTTLALITYLICFVFLIYNFKDTVMKLRRGIYEFPKAKVPISLTSSFIGFNVLNSMISFLIVTIIVGVVFTILIHPLFWKLLWDYKYTILTILITPVVKAVLKMIALKLLLDPLSHIKHPRIFAVFQFVMIYLSIVAGFLSAIARIVIMAVVGIVGLVRIDRPLGPDWFLNILYLDSFNSSYYATAYIYHIHNNPIAITFVNMLREIWEDSDEGVPEYDSKQKKKNSISPEKEKLKEKIVRNKLRKCLLLTKNPSLIAFRKKGKEKQQQDQNKTLALK